MPRGPIVLAVEKSIMLRMEIAGKSRSEIARELKRSKATVTKVLGAKFKGMGRPRKQDSTTVKE